MGEVNIDLLEDKPRLIEKPFPWTDTQNPVCAIGRLKSGPAVLVNLAPRQDNKYSLIIAPGTMLDVRKEDIMTDSIRGWFRPSMNISDFLEKYSRAGGTHHSALVYTNAVNEIAGFGELMGWKTEVLV